MLKTIVMAAGSMMLIGSAAAQTEQDAIMMNKNQLCGGFMYNHGSWKDYWEGTLKRENLNLGTVTAQSMMFMANYGITDNLNIMAGAPYVWTHASAGTLHGMKGIQDVSVTLKWRALNFKFANNDKLAVYAMGGISTPLDNYVIDFLPLSIGLGSTNLTGRVMVDYLHNRFFATAWGSYIFRSNVKIDRDAYYDEELHNSNEVKMPDQVNLQLRTGYRGRYLIAEALLTQLCTLGGFDITRNNMPFPSNQMNSTVAGINFKYTLKQLTNISLLAGANYTIHGRNVGQTTAFNGGVFYAFYTKKSSRKPTNNLQ
ncbi:hypothetical protein FPE01S_04_05170 [Flavihumibacter petaseus NBRC 106054]|uniref:Transporter n=2 Tax=Flavihumibacter TaxID=1004301 RepID=A0A0E9N641_9BACT|nr:hypothetical protein FPE01S_04_05170 [Flavihumibacter petaseus NBRC 106054]